MGPFTIRDSGFPKGHNARRDHRIPVHRIPVVVALLDTGRSDHRGGDGDDRSPVHEVRIRCAAVAAFLIFGLVLSITVLKVAAVGAVVYIAVRLAMRSRST